MPRDTLSSSDEEEDREALVQQNDTKPYRRAAFDIAENTNTARTHAAAKTSPSLIVILVAVVAAISIPTVLILVVRRNAFASTTNAARYTEADMMREAELRAVYLLREQRLDLVKTWNTTASWKNSSLEDIEEIRSALMRQIKINTQIQSVLLSRHRSRNSSANANSSDDGVGFDLFGGLDGQMCKKLSREGDRRTIEWKPEKDRFLFAICVSGQMSNHLICLENHMFFAALLGRVLVFPSAKFDYQYDVVLDIKHINECFGRKVVMSFDEFAQSKKNKIKINKFLCYMASPPCYLDEDHIKKLKSLGIDTGKVEAVWPEDAKLKTQKSRVVADIMPKFSVSDEVIAIGDMFYANVEEEWVMQPGGPLAHKCKTVIQPSRLIYLTAQRFVQTFLGANFVALHFRRHGFLKFCNAKEESCFFPIPQAAECIQRVLEKVNAPVIYLSTDAADSEINLLQSLVVMNDRKVPLVRRPEHTSVEKWDALLYRNHMGGDNQVDAMLDKTICALSSVFIGASGSTFTEDIIRLRRGWESASQCDDYLCQGELPNYIAQNE